MFKHIGTTQQKTGIDTFSYIGNNFEKIKYKGSIYKKKKNLKTGKSITVDEYTGRHVDQKLKSVVIKRELPCNGFEFTQGKDFVDEAFYNQVVHKCSAINGSFKYGVSILIKKHNGNNLDNYLIQNRKTLLKVINAINQSFKDCHMKGVLQIDSFGDNILIEEHTNGSIKAHICDLGDAVAIKNSNLVKKYPMLKTGYLKLEINNLKKIIKNLVNQYKFLLSTNEWNQLNNKIEQDIFDYDYQQFDKTLLSSSKPSSSDNNRNKFFFKTDFFIDDKFALKPNKNININSHDGYLKKFL